MIKKLQVRNGIIACVLGFTLMTEAGCGLLSSDEDVILGNIENATAERYYDIKKDGIEFFVSKSDLGEALPEYNCTYYVGLRVDENGNYKKPYKDENEKINYCAFGCGSSCCLY